MNLIANRILTKTKTTKTTRNIVCRACKLAHVANDMDCPNCGFWCSPSCYETFWKKDEAQRLAVKRTRVWKSLGCLAVGATLGFLGWGQIGVLFWLAEVFALAFAGFIPALLLLIENE